MSIYNIFNNFFTNQKKKYPSPQVLSSPTPPSLSLSLSLSHRTSHILVHSISTSLKTSWLLLPWKAQPWQRSGRSCSESGRLRSGLVGNPTWSGSWPFRKPNRSPSSAKSTTLVTVALARTTHKNSSKKPLKSLSLYVLHLTI